MRIKAFIYLDYLYNYRVPVFNYVSKNKTISLFFGCSEKKSIDHPIEFNNSIFKKYIFKSFQYVRGLYSVAKDHEVIVVTFDFHQINNLLLFLNPFKKFKLVFWGIGYGNNKWFNYFRTFVAKRCKALILYSEDAKAQFIANGVNPEKIFIAHNTVLVNREENYKDYNRNNILVVGSLVRRKKINELIEVFASIKDEISSKIKIDIIGKGDDRIFLENEVERLGLKERVIFHGQIMDQHKLIDFYNKSLISVSPSQAGLSVLQSFGYGVPFMTRTDAISGGEKNNIIDGERGFFYDSKEQMKAKLIAYLGNTEKQKEMSENCYDYFWSERTIANMGNGIIDAIKYVSES